MPYLSVFIYYGNEILQYDKWKFITFIRIHYKDCIVSYDDYVVKMYVLDKL